MAEELSITESAVLGLLTFGERSGYELDALAKQTIGFFWRPAKSKIYVVLPRLVDRGLASASTIAQEKRPDKTVYRITARGKHELRAGTSAPPAVYDGPWGTLGPPSPEASFGSGASRRPQLSRRSWPRGRGRRGRTTGIRRWRPSRSIPAPTTSCVPRRQTSPRRSVQPRRGRVRAIGSGGSHDVSSSRSM
jgi:DNA-binding PadR family transcriptional regulator